MKCLPPAEGCWVDCGHPDSCFVEQSSLPRVDGGYPDSGLIHLEEIGDE